MGKKLYLNSGGNEITLQSGDTGLYVDIDLNHLTQLLKENPKVKREWTSQSGTTGQYVRVFILPKKNPKGYHSFYLELAYPKKENSDNSFEF